MYDKLDCEEATIYEVEHHKLQDFIKKCYELDQDYSLIHFEEWNNGSCWHHFTVCKGTLDECDKDMVQAFKSKKVPACPLWILLQDMCNKNLINPGVYAVKVSW